MSDIRKWFMKKHDKDKDRDNGSTNSNSSQPPERHPPPAVESPVQGGQGRRKTSKFFAVSAGSSKEPASKAVKEEIETEKTPAKRKGPVKAADDDVKPSPPKKIRQDEDDDDDFESPSAKKKVAEARPSIQLKKSVDMDESDDDNEVEEKDAKTPTKSAWRGRGGRGPGVTALAAGGRGRGGGGRGGFMNFGERKDPPHKGEKVAQWKSQWVPLIALAGLTFVISGTLDSLEREEAEDLIKQHGGRVTGSVSKKTNFLLADEDVGGRKSLKTKELGTAFLTEDGLFDMIRKTKPVNTTVKEDPKKKSEEKADGSQIKSSPMKVKAKDYQPGSTSSKSIIRNVQSSAFPCKQKARTGEGSSLTWTEKYKPKVPNEIIGNQTIVKQLHDWLAHWHEQFLHNDQKGKGKKQNDSGFKKAVLLSGTPGIGKSTSAKLISQMLGFQAIEVNASDSRGKADSKILKGIGGSTSNSIKELVSNEALSSSKDWSKHPKTVLIMDEVDGMSSGDRGGVADLIASITNSKIPIICICNDRYSQKLKSLVNYCMLLTFRKPTKQQMAKRLKQIATAEGLQVENDNALEELGDRVSGDMRMAINQLQYMSLSHSVIGYNNIRVRLRSSAKDEDISPFTAVDKLFGFNGGKLQMDERIDLSMSDPDLLPLIIQENYINYRPASIGKDENGVKRLNLLAQAADSIGNGDIINVQIRRYRQWQLSQASSFASCIIPAALMHGGRETFEPGERNYNRFSGWLGKNSTMGKSLRLLEDAHVHILSSQTTNLDRETLRIDYFSLLVKELTAPLRVMPKDDAVQKVLELMNDYSLSQEDFDTIVELSKFQKHPNPLDGIQPAVKAALTKAYKEASKSRVVRAADLIPLPGLKKAPRKRIAAILEPVDPVDGALPEESGDALVESEEESTPDAEDTDGIKINGETKPKLDLQSDKLKGIRVQLDLRSDEKSNGKKTPARKSKASGSAQKDAAARWGKRKR